MANWETIEERFDREVTPKLAYQVDTRAIKDFYRREIIAAERRGRDDTVQRIKYLNLWSKGTVEGTRQDIIAKLGPGGGGGEETPA